MATLFERIGGDPAVNAAVDRFYEIVLADDRIRHFFVGVDMGRQATHQKVFLKYAFGGLPSYPGRAMKEAHKRLVNEMGLNDAHFDAVIDDLGTALRGLGVSEDMIGGWIPVVQRFYEDIPASQTVAALLFVALCMYVWRSSSKKVEG